MAKALSIRAPWWWLIIHGGKDIENREWTDKNPGLRFRGPVLIHASAWFVKSEVIDALEIAHTIAGLQGVVMPDVTLAELRASGGCLVARARVVDIVQRSDSPWFHGPRGLVLADVEALPAPIPCKGALGFFDVPEGTST